MLQTSKEAILTYYKPLSSAFIALTLSELSASLGRIKETWSEFFIPVSLQRALSSLHIAIPPPPTPNEKTGRRERLPKADTFSPLGEGSATRRLCFVDPLNLKLDLFFNLLGVLKRLSIVYSPHTRF